MYKRDFDKVLQKWLPSATLLYGENNFYFDFYRDYYIKKLDAKETLLEQLFDDYDFSQAKSYLSQASLFGDANLYILRRDKKIPKRELEELIELSTKSSNNYFLYIFEGSSSDAKSFQNLFNKKDKALWVRFFEPNYKEAYSFALSRAKSLNLQISNYTLSYLVNLLNSNLSLIDSELKKLSILNQEITTDIIDELVYSTAPLAVEKMIVALFNRKDIRFSLRKVIEMGEDEFAIIRAIQRFLNQIFLFFAYREINGKVDSKEILGYKLPRNIEQERVSIVNRLNRDKLSRIYQEILELELRLKKSKLDRESILYSGLVKLKEIF